MIILTERTPKNGPRMATKSADDKTYMAALNTLKNTPKTWEKYDLKSWDSLAEILKMETDELIAAIKARNVDQIHENIIHSSAVLMLMERL